MRRRSTMEPLPLEPESAAPVRPHAGGSGSNRSMGRLMAATRVEPAPTGPVPLSFPFRQRIESSLASMAAAEPAGGPPPRLPGTAVVDPSRCSDRQVPAFTDGLLSHFASDRPSLHMAAHEAAHQLQHAGAVGDGGHGAERHAHLVAEAVTTNRARGNLLGRSGSSVPSGTRDYTVYSTSAQAGGEWDVGSTARVGDQGRTVTTEYKHECFAASDLIAQANAILKAKKSGVRIEAGGAGPSGYAPDGSGFKETREVQYTILSDEDNEEFWADCGRSAREVQGPTGSDTLAKGIYRDAAGNRQETRRSGDPQIFQDEILQAGGLGSSADDAYTAYQALTPAERNTFDRTHGINRYATPQIGEAFTRRRDDRAGGSGFNWHWGGVILVAGGDRVTFENYAKGEGYDAQDEDWYFETYGPPSRPGQTWHEQWESVGGAGLGTTMAAATSADPSAFIPGAASLTTADIIARLGAGPPEGEKMALAAELDDRWLMVTVDVKSAQEGTDEVYVTAAHGKRRYETASIDLTSGQRNTFWVPMSALTPITGKIVVKVFDSDVLSDDMISIIDFDSPYGPQSDNRPWDDAEYHTSVEFDR